MAIRRQKLNRNSNLTFDLGHVIDMSPGWIFTVDCAYHGKIEFDFNSFREYGRDGLAGQMRDAIWSLRHEVVGATLKHYDHAGLRNFWRFLDDLHCAGESITRLDQVDRFLIERYLTWLELRVVNSSSGEANFLSLGAKKSAFDSLKALLVNRQKRVPNAVSLDLNFPRNPFPNSNNHITKRDVYSPSEQKRILDALNKDLRTIHEGDGTQLTNKEVLIVHLLVLGMTTGRNLQSLMELKRNSLQEHPLPDRELLVTTKRRGWSTHATSLRKVDPEFESLRTLQPIPTTVGDHFRFLCEFTASLADEAADENRDFVFIWRVTQGGRTGQVVRINADNANPLIRAFVRRHVLLDDRGVRLMLNIARMRPTFGTELYKRTRDIRCVQKALGHANAETTARSYTDVPLEAERDHAIVLDSMVIQFTRVEIDGKVLLAADGKIPLQNVQDLLSGGYNSGIARCRNPFRDNDSVCRKFFACFNCPSMIIFEDDLWRLFSFYYRLLHERAKISLPQWMKTYGPIIRRIDTDIAPQFPEEKAEAARFKAQQNPHPTWKGPLL